MAKARAILKRRKAVQNIRKITRTMQLISTARFQRSFNRATASKPYSEKIKHMVAHASKHVQIDHPLLRAVEEPKRIALLVITANRGLCGGYNSQVLAESLEFLGQCEGRDVELSVVGKKGIAYIRFLKRRITREYLLGDNPNYGQVEEIAQQYIDEFSRGALDAVHVAYTQFHSTSKQEPGIVQLLPVSAVADDEEDGVLQPGYRQYEFTPPASDLLAELLPESVKVVLYQCFTDAIVSEHVSRMVAMKAATDNADEMAKHLTRQANRARQAQITRELSELMAVSG